MALPFFAWRSTTLTAFRALQSSQPTTFQRGAINVGITGPAASITTAIGGNVLCLGHGGALNGFQIQWPGYTNFAPLQGLNKISVLTRFAFFTAVGNAVIFSLGGGVSGYFPGLFGFALNGADTRAQINNYSGAAIYNANPYTWTSVTGGIMYDLLVTYDGATNASNYKTWVNGVNVATAGAGAGYNFDISKMIQIVLGGGMNGLTDTNIAVNEFAIWGEIIDASSVTLSGQGATGLIGPARDKFIEAIQFRGDFSLDPGIGNVATGVSYAIAGASLVGTLSVGGSTSGGSAELTIGAP